MANRKIAHAVRAALLSAGAAGAGLYGPAVVAQEGLEEIVVTGTRIAKRDAIAESPIYTVDQESFKVSGYVTVEQYLNTLPQLVPNISSQSNNPSSGGRAFVDLRGLGPNRNLVLIDGRRPMGQAGGGTIVDVNMIPAALIERVEVISGGAAAVYGADAVAGVVNFIMKKSFDGMAIDAQYRETEEGDGEEKTADLTSAATSPAAAAARCSTPATSPATRCTRARAASRRRPPAPPASSRTAPGRPAPMRPARRRSTPSSAPTSVTPTAARAASASTPTARCSARASAATRTATW
jgi:outer membrane receptor protein involved in Fe transport